MSDQQIQKFQILTRHDILMRKRLQILYKYEMTKIPRLFVLYIHLNLSRCKGILSIGILCA